MEVLICKQGTKKFDKYKHHLCGDCPFLYTYKGESYLDDMVACHCDVTLKKGQKFKIRTRCEPL